MMTERCPLCSARLAGAAICPRCGADLSLSQAAHHGADQCLRQALACLTTGERQRGAVHAEQALLLHRTPLAEVVASWLKAPTSPCTSDMAIPAGIRRQVNDDQTLAQRPTAPEACSQAQGEELDRLIEPWVDEPEGRSRSR